MLNSKHFSCLMYLFINFILGLFPDFQKSENLSITLRFRKRGYLLFT